jgi:hypothetical protein
MPKMRPNAAGSGAIFQEVNFSPQETGQPAAHLEKEITDGNHSVARKNN